MTNYDPNRPEEPEVLSPGEARQAPSGRPVLYVLIAGLALALFAWAAVELYPVAPDTPTTAERQVTSPQIAQEPLTKSEPSTATQARESTASVPAAKSATKPATQPATPAPATEAAPKLPPPAGSEAVTGGAPAR